MIKRIFTFVTFVSPAVLIVVAAFSSAANDQNTVTFDNQSGEPALVRLLGPTANEVEVPSGMKKTVAATAGKYTMKVRYGQNGKFRYTKGEEFEVTETASTRSSITITLHKVAAGNYESRPISENDFATLAAVSPNPGPKASDTSGNTNGPKTLHITDGKQYKAVNNDSALQEYLNRTIGVEYETSDGRIVNGILMKGASGYFFIENSGDLWVMPRSNNPEAEMRFEEPCKKNIKLLLSVLNEKDATNRDDALAFRKKIIEALGILGDAKAKPQLTKISKQDSSPEIRDAAKAALKKLRKK